jgi:hypothetical protein
MKQASVMGTYLTQLGTFRRQVLLTDHHDYPDKVTSHVISVRCVNVSVHMTVLTTCEYTLAYK